MLRIIIVLSLIMPVALMFNPVTQAQTDAKTPAALCEEAQPNITEPSSRSFDEPEQVLEDDVDYYAIFCTESGAVFVDLLEQYAPITVNSFVFLAQEGFYNNSNFHRVMADFMAQGGDPVGNPPGTGGPGYQFQDEFLPFLTFERPGWLAMANSGPSTNGSQFFITRVPTTHLNWRHTIFGEVLEGQEVVDNMPDTDAGGNDALYTVLIITDPAQVETTFAAPTPATGDEVLDAINGIFGEDPALSNIENAVYDLDEAVGRVEPGAQEAARDLYESHGFGFEAGGFWEVATCEEPALLGIGTWVTDWGTAENAAGFTSDSSFDELMTTQGFSLIDSSETFTGLGYTTELFYSRPDDGFCSVPATRYRYTWHRERYTITLDVIIAQNVVPEEQVPMIIADRIARTVASLLGDIILDGRVRNIG